jgi:hypothetical protein
MFIGSFGYCDPQNMYSKEHHKLYIPISVINLVISSPIFRLELFDFYKFHSLRSLFLPDGVERIPSCCFKQCRELEIVY